jgi:hypothetical protein
MLYFPDKRRLACLLVMTFAVPAMAEPPPWLNAMSAYRLSNTGPKEVPRVMRYGVTPQLGSAEDIPWLMRFTHRPSRPFMVVYDAVSGKACQVIEPGDCTAATPPVPQIKGL